MAIDPNALTLSEWAHLSNDPLVLKITESLHKTLNILQDIPLVTDETLNMVGMRYVDTLPGVNWGQINKAPTVVKGKPTPYEEQAFLIRNQFQVDKRLVNNKNNIQSPVQTEIDMFMEALTYELNFRFILNDPTNQNDLTNGLAPGTTSGSTTGMAQFAGNGDAWVGLATRMNNPAQYGIPSEMLINGTSIGTGLDLTAATLGSTTAGVPQAASNLFIESVQQMLDTMNAPEGDGVVFYCNDLLKRRWERAVRTSGAGGGFDITRDAFDRPVATYKNAKIRDVGRLAPLAGANQSLRVISPFELPTGAPSFSGQTNANYTSLYAVRYGDGYFKGWQTNPLKPDNLGVDPTNGVMINIVVDWGAGLWQQHNRSVCRLFGIKISP
jgi:hypothetical protein